jgi:hypothetical protein
METMIIQQWSNKSEDRAIEFDGFWKEANISKQQTVSVFDSESDDSSVLSKTKGLVIWEEFPSEFCLVYKDGFKIGTINFPTRGPIDYSLESHRIREEIIDRLEKGEF